MESRSKPSEKPGLPENPTHQAAGTGAEPGSDSNGEHRSRDLRVDKADGTDFTIVLGSGCTVVHVDRYQSRRDAGFTGLLGVPHSQSISRRQKTKYLDPSKLS